MLYDKLSVDLPKPYSFLVQEMKQRGIALERIDETPIIKASYGERQYLFSQYILPVVPSSYPRLLDNKRNFKAILRYYKIPYVPNSKAFSYTDRNAAIKYIKETIGFPVVCKPQFGSGSKLVFANIQDEEELTPIWERYYKDLDCSILVEEYLPNTNDYRFFVFKQHNPIIHVRFKAQVTGNGQHIIRELIELQDLHTTYLDHPDLSRVLSHQGFTLASVPEATTPVLLDYCTRMLREELYTHISFHDVHTEYIELVHKLWAIFPKMPYFSVDILSTNLALPPDEASVGISEAHVGASPILDMNVHHSKIEVISNFVDILFPETQ